MEGDSDHRPGDSLEDRLVAIENGLAQLTDLFRRRLYEDRDKKRAFDALYGQLETMQRALRGEFDLPLLREVFLVIDRLDGQGDVDFVESLRSELMEILRRHGVEEVASSGHFDPSIHEAIEQREVAGAEDEGRVVAVLRRGFAREGRLLRAAQVAVGYTRDPEDAGEA